MIVNVTATLVSVFAIAALIFGNGVFVAAELSLTALDRSTVEANARRGGWRDRLIQRAQNGLSFQLSGAQLGISITTLATGYLTELHERAVVGVQSAAGFAEGHPLPSGW